MALSYITYTGNGAQTAYALPFEYIDASDVTATVNGVAAAGTASGGTFTFSTAPANGGSIRIQRDTDREDRVVDFSQGSTLTEEDLDNSHKQVFFLAQEYLDEQDEVVLGQVPDGSITANKIADGVVANAKLANMARYTVKGRSSSGTGVPEDVDVSDLSLIADGASVRRDLSARAAETLSVLDFGAVGDGSATDTTAIQTAITAAATARRRLIFPATSTSFRTGPLTIPSNSHLIFEPGCTIRAIAGYGANDRMLSFDGASDVLIEAYGATFQMEKAEYVSGEQRHVFYLTNCTRVTVLGGTAKDSGGDGYYINGATDCRMVDVVADNNRRNGISIIKATRLNITRPYCKNQTGTAPNDGIDIEPNAATDTLQDIVIDSALCEDNDGNGFTIYLDQYKAGSPADARITLNNPISRSNSGYGFRIRNIFLNAGSYGGFVELNNPVSVEDAWHAYSILNKGKDAPVLKINNPVAIDPCLADLGSPNYAAVYLSDDSACSSGEIHIQNLSIKCDHTGMDYGVFVEVGQGFSGLRMSISDIKGQQIEPVRWNSLTPAVGEASDALIDCSNLKAKNAKTSGINVTADLVGRVLTNLGAVGTVTFNLRDYLPAGNRYRFAVEAAFTLAIDTFDATDRIVGTTTAGATITCATPGEACEVEFIGTIGGVRYWRPTILGRQSNWTFN